MRMGIVKISVPRLLVLTGMLLALGFAGFEEGVVLCFEGDGRVAIEASGPEGCSDGANAASRAASAVAIPISSSHCGPCVDLALTASSASEGVTVAKRSTPTPAAIPIAGTIPPVPRLRLSDAYRSTTGFISEKAHTVVIRC
jgi:hypothetical protein